MKEQVYATSEDCQQWPFESLDEAVQAAFDEDENHAFGSSICVYRGEKKAIKLSAYLPDIAQNIEELALEDFGDINDGNIFSPEQRGEFNAAVKVFVNKYADENGLQPEFFRVESVEEIQVRITGEEDCEVDFETVAIR